MSQQKTVRLKNGSEELGAFVAATMMILRQMATEQPIVLFELFEVCRDRSHTPFGTTGETLRGTKLMDANGGVHDSIRNVVLSAVKMEAGGVDFSLDNPVAQAQPAPTDAKKFAVYRNDNQPFQTADGETITERRFATHDEAAEFIDTLPDKAAVEAGDYSLDAPETWDGSDRKLFILWDYKDGNPPRTDGGGFTTDGIIGRVGLDNVYLTTYGARPDGAPKYDDLEIGGCVRGVVFRLSGERGEYDVFRVA